MAKHPKESRPSIWIEGQQNPRFEARAFALASVQFARADLARLLARTAVSGQDFGAKIASGRWRLPPERWGRTGRYLPSVESTGAAISFAAEVLAGAGMSVSVQSEAVEPHPISLPGRIEARSARLSPSPAEKPAATPMRPVRPQPKATMARPIKVPMAEPPPSNASDDELAAIRFMIASAEAGPKPHPQNRRIAVDADAYLPTPRTQPPPFDEVPRQQSKAGAMLATAGSSALTGLKSLPIKRDWVVKALAYPLGYGLLVAAVPVGMVRATLAHLNGQDLRKILAE